MLKDAFDRILWVLLAVTLAALVGVLFSHETGDRVARAGGGVDKALERQMAYQARVDLLRKLYGPVESLRQAGDL
ncbi:MAG TPA: hypothetical protein VK187_14755, partial [Geobacteraceae bacterium]|nr:hypothetical protein [Geobacteraceae bacterium]